MRILYLGSFPPEFLIKKSEGKIDSLYRDDQAIIKGLRCQEGVNLEVITSPDIASWPRGPLFLQTEKNVEEGLVMVSSLNISFLKQLWTISSMAIEASKFIRKSKDRVVVVIPYIVFRHVFTLRLLKHLFPKKVVQAVVVPDIFFPNRWLLERANRWTENMAMQFDAYILYTKKMAERLHVKEGHYEVIEGFREVPARKPVLSNDFKIVYAGSLNLNYGIGRLLEALPLIKDPNVQLHLYGAGSAVPLIKKISERDKRLYFHGRVPNVEAVNAIYSASILINPRNAEDGEYTEYSFPSKDIEYMATGIPTLLCKLPGMPEEYYGHFIDMGAASPEEIAEGIKRVKAMGKEERDSLGRSARSFIIERMDCDKQGERIVNLFNSVIKEKTSI